MYYFCRQNLFENNNIIEIVGHTDVTGTLLWTAGHKFKRSIPQQILQLNPDYGTELPSFFDTTIPVMSEELIQVFHDSGVDNFDAYPMILKRMDNNEEFHNYKAVNFIGSINCIDLDKSVYELNKRNKPRRFKSIIIDDSKTHGAKVFRLSIGPDLLVIHKDIADQLIKHNFKALLLQKTEDFDGF